MFPVRTCARRSRRRSPRPRRPHSSAPGRSARRPWPGRSRPWPGRSRTTGRVLRSSSISNAPGVREALAAAPERVLRGARGSGRPRRGAAGAGAPRGAASPLRRSAAEGRLPCCSAALPGISSGGSPRRSPGGSCSWMWPGSPSPRSAPPGWTGSGCAAVSRAPGSRLPRRPGRGGWSRSQRTFLERDIPGLGSKVAPEALGRFWRMLAHWHGQPWNAAEIARSMDAGVTAVNHYRDLPRRLVPDPGAPAVVREPRGNGSSSPPGSICATAASCISSGASKTRGSCRSTRVTAPVGKASPWSRRCSPTAGGTPGSTGRSAAPNWT